MRRALKLKEFEIAQVRDIDQAFVGRLTQTLFQGDTVGVSQLRKERDQELLKVMGPENFARYQRFQMRRTTASSQR